MAKLLNPFQYRNPLGGLNSVRPLDFTGKVNQSVDIVALDSSKADSNKRAVGKLLRCDDNGSMLSKIANGFTDTEYYSPGLYPPDHRDSFTFSRKVFGVLWLFDTSDFMTSIVWTNPDYSADLQTLPLLGSAWIPFVGTTIYFLGHPELPFGSVIGHIYGFY